MLLRTADADVQVRFDIRSTACIQLFVEQRMNQLAHCIARHTGTFRTRADRHSIRRARARESRDITVPRGADIAAAISLYENSSSSLITTTSRYSAGSSSMHHRTESISVCLTKRSSVPMPSLLCLSSSNSVVDAA